LSGAQTQANHSAFDGTRRVISETTIGENLEGHIVVSEIRNGIQLGNQRYDFWPSAIWRCLPENLRVRGEMWFNVIARSLAESRKGR